MSHPLLEMADRFDLYASDQRASIRWQRSRRASADCITRSEIWADAAKELRAAYEELSSAAANLERK